MDCVFCKIINGEILSMKICEDEHTLAFMDNAKDVDGHILEVPKRHIKNITQPEKEQLQKRTSYG